MRVDGRAKGEFIINDPMMMMMTMLHIRYFNIKDSFSLLKA